MCVLSDRRRLSGRGPGGNYAFLDRHADRCSVLGVFFGRKLNLTTAEIIRRFLDGGLHPVSSRSSLCLFPPPPLPIPSCLSKNLRGEGGGLMSACRYWSREGEHLGALTSGRFPGLISLVFDVKLDWQLPWQEFGPLEGYGPHGLSSGGGRGRGLSICDIVSCLEQCPKPELSNSASFSLEAVRQVADLLVRNI